MSAFLVAANTHAQYYHPTIIHAISTVSVADLQHMTVENALGDIARLVSDARDRLNAANATVVLWGSGTGAKFAVWTRQKYPHLVDAVWSSSGRFLAEPVSESFYNQLSWHLHSVGEQQCENRVQELFAHMLHLIETGDSAQLQQQLNVCDPIAADSPNDVAMFVEGIIYHIADFLETSQ